MAKLCWLICLFSLLVIRVSGQAIPNTVLGKIVESASHDPIEFVVVTLRLLPDSSTVKSTQSDANGDFSFTDPVPGQYFIEANLLGFQTVKTSAFVLDGIKGYDTGSISLVVSDVTLQQIEVVANTQAFVNGIDRKIYYPEHDIQSQSGSATDILQNIPSVVVGPEGQVFLRGSENIQYLLNGKTSTLLNANSEVILEQIPAHTIERIEIITNPSAKYKPDGIAGIINIVTKKNTLNGFHGSVLGNASTQQRYNGNISLNYNTDKFSIGGLYSYWQNYSPRTYTDFRIVRDTFSEDEFTFDLNNAIVAKPRSHTATFNLDYLPDEKNSFGAACSYFGFHADRDAEATTLETNMMGTISDYTTLRTEANKESELELSANGEHIFRKEDHTISFEVTYSNSDELNDSRSSDIYRYPEYPQYDGHNIQDIKAHMTALSVDYSNPFNEDLVFETGYEGEYASGDLDYYYEYFDDNDLTWRNDTLKTNRFLYQQDIHAAYATLSKTFEKFGVLGGLRAEQTKIESNLVTYDSIIPNEYFNLFPTLHLSYEIDEEQELGLSYSRRVNRPDPDELNPFPEYTNLRDIEAGNPELKPEQIHSLELGYHYHHDQVSFLPTLYYRQTFDGFSDESYYINDSTLFTTIVNLEKKWSAGLELVFSWSPSRKFNFNLNSNIYHQTIDATELGYDDDNKSSVSADTKLAAYYNVLTATRLQFNATYRSSMLTAQGKSLPVYFINAGLKQELFQKKASLTLTVSDIFNTMRWRYIIDTPSLYQEVTRKRKSQVVYLGFSYRFGISPKGNETDLLYDDKL